MSADRIKEYMTTLCRSDYCDPTEIMRTYCDFAKYVVANPDQIATMPAWRIAIRKKAQQILNLDAHGRRLIHDGYDLKAIQTSKFLLWYLDQALPLNEKYVA